MKAAFSAVRILKKATPFFLCLTLAALNFSPLRAAPRNGTVKYNVTYAATASLKGGHSSSRAAAPETAKAAAGPGAASPSLSSAASSAGKYVTGYYGGWAAYSGLTPDKLDASNLDVLNYAFAAIGPNLNVTASDDAVDYQNFVKLRSLKSRFPRLKTVISIGGWDDSGRFSDAALTAASRAAFADSAAAFMKEYGFDGIDIDWEYPTGGGLASNVSRSADKKNFVLLLAALRSRLDAQGAADGRHYLLSFAGEANSTYADGVGLSSVAKYVDYGFIMTYDLHGGWDAFTDFNAPLYTPAGTSPEYKGSVDEAVDSWLSAGFPAGKLILGVPFYGHAYSGAAGANGGLWQRYTSCTTVGFDTIASNYLADPSYKKSYSGSAQVPSLFNGSTFISYDDETSLAQKAKYSLGKGLLGVGAWDLSYDPSGLLLSAIKTALG